MLIYVARCNNIVTTVSGGWLPYVTVIIRVGHHLADAHYVLLHKKLSLCVG
jgi:hypothetical protein